MPLVAQKEHEELPDFKEVKGGLGERFVDRLKRHPQKLAWTSFMRNPHAMEEFRRIVEEVKERRGSIVINDVGAGMEERSKFYRYISEYGVRGKLNLIKSKITRMNVAYEPFELLNEIRNAGIKPEGFSLCVIDARSDVLLAVKSTKVLNIRVSEGTKEYLEKFFPEFHGEERGGHLWNSIPVRIPEEYRKKIICPKPLDIEKGPIPEADITYSFLYTHPSKDEVHLKNLAKSTKAGGYVITDVHIESADTLKEMGLERVSFSHDFVVYRVKTS